VATGAELLQRTADIEDVAIDRLSPELAAIVEFWRKAARAKLRNPETSIELNAGIETGDSAARRRRNAWIGAGVWKSAGETLNAKATAFVADLKFILARVDQDKNLVRGLRPEVLTPARLCAFWAIRQRCFIPRTPRQIGAIAVAWKKDRSLFPSHLQDNGSVNAIHAPEKSECSKT
jgi:hypothetical protein